MIYERKKSYENEIVSGESGKNYYWCGETFLAFSVRSALPTMYYVLTDANKNVCALVSESGEVAAKYDYTPFGKLINTFNNPNSAFRNPFLFSSEYHDEETGLVYYNYRYYNPELGRWMSCDPIGERGGFNLYGMVNNSPINYVDYLGLDWYNPFTWSESSSTWYNPFSWGNGAPVELSPEFYSLNHDGSFAAGNRFQYESNTTLDKDCGKIDILIKLPKGDEPDKLARKGMGGHTGISINGQFYDYGPDTENATGRVEPGDGVVVGIPGYMWYDNPLYGIWNPKVVKSPDDILFDDILYAIPHLASGKKVYVITMFVCPSQAKLIEDYWKNLYSDTGVYSALGLQCTTSVMQSLERGGVYSEPSFTWSPEGFLNHLKTGVLKNTCGKNKGQSAKIKQIQ